MIYKVVLFRIIIIKSVQVIAGALDAESDDESFESIIVLALQNTAIITLLIYLAAKINEK